MCFIVFLPQFILPGTRWVSWTWLKFYFLSHVSEVFSYYIFKYLLRSSLSCPSRAPIVKMLVFLMLSQRSLMRRLSGSQQTFCNFWLNETKTKHSLGVENLQDDFSLTPWSQGTEKKRPAPLAEWLCAGHVLNTLHTISSSHILHDGQSHLPKAMEPPGLEPKAAGLKAWTLTLKSWLRSLC